MLDTIIASLFAAHWQFCIYGALAGILCLRAFRALKTRNYYEAREHGVEGLIHAILALLHL